VSDLREALQAAYAKYENPEQESPAEEVESVEEKQDPEPQDESSQEAARQPAEGSDEPAESEAQDTREEPSEADPEPPKPARKPPPSSWKKDYWEAWEKLDSPVADYIHQREQEFTRGVTEYKRAADYAKPLVDAIAPYQPMLQQLGVTPDQAVQRLLNAQYILESGTQDQRTQLIRGFAQQYGVDLHGPPEGADPQAYARDQAAAVALADTRRMQQAMWQQQQQNQLAAQQQQAQLEIERFASAPGHEHFETVKSDMGALLQAGLAKDLDDAYNQAIRLSDTWLESEFAKRQADAEKARKEKAKADAARAKAAAVSTRSGTPTGSQEKGPQQAENIRQALEDAWNNVMSRG
jgi:hypothetical protein